MRIDAHQVFWRSAPEGCGRVGAPHGSVQREFLPSELAPLLAENGIEACIAVQQRRSDGETHWLLERAGAHPWIAGVVGWLDLCADDAAEQIELAARDARLVGLCHAAADEPDDLLAREDFRRGLGHLARHGLAYDLHLGAPRWADAIDLAGRHPAQTFVLDHLGKPALSRRAREPWAAELRALAAHRNVACKLSGLAPETDAATWRAWELTPFLDTALEVFGVERVMFGSDRPPLAHGASYARWRELVESWSSSLTPAERDTVLGGTAARIYGLEAPAG